MAPGSAFLPKRSHDFWLLAGFLLLIGFTASGARGDLLSLIVVRPVAMLLCAYGLFRLTGQQASAHRWFLVFAGLVTGLVALHLVPLPPAVWQALPGRDLVADIDRAAGLGDVWRPLTLAPAATRNALFSLSIPLAAGLLMIQLDGEERAALLGVIVLFALASLALAVLQLSAPGAQGLWPYRITNDRLPVGLFSNRNHSSVFLAAMLPVLAVWAQMPTRSPAVLQLRRIVAVAAGVAILPVILASGSRAGLLLGALALVLVPVFIQPGGGSSRSRRPARASAPAGRLAAITPRRVLIAAIAIALLGIVASAFSGSGGSSASRLAESSDEELRAKFWAMTAPLAADYLPLGSGAGSFVETLKAGEPVREVKPSYVNHAHNDLLETALTTGLPGIALMLAAGLALASQGWRAWRAPSGPGHVQRARLASTFLAFMVLASIVDYPLRVPTLVAIAVIMAFWLDPRGRPGRADEGQLRLERGAAA